ncbi:MAG TPA: hypothetical protein VK464_13965 [Symbiobacteriaceae bacterium]|nr:hypothetical protein [Symbiobacteriaceae bacterium]
MAEEPDVMALLRAAYEAGKKAALFDQTDAGRTRAVLGSTRKPRLAGRPVGDEEWQH